MNFGCEDMNFRVICGNVRSYFTKNIDTIDTKNQLHHPKVDSEDGPGK